jgi:tight adherence protein B
MLLIVAVCFVAFALLFWMVIGTGIRMKEERRMAARMLLARSGSPRDPGDVGDEEVDRAMSWIPPTVADAGGRVARVGGFGATLDVKLEQSGLPLKGGEFVVLTVLAAIGGGVLAVVLGLHELLAALVAVVAGAVPYIVVRRGISKRDAKLKEQLPDVLTIMASSLRAGHSFLQALDTVAKEIDEPAATEFNRVVAEIRLGRPAEDALASMGDRIGSEDFKWAVLAINIQREVGGNLAELLVTVADTMTERERLRRDVNALTAEGKISAIVLGILPLGIGLFIMGANPGYMDPLFDETLGNFLLGGAVVLMLFGFYWMKKTIEIDI